MNPTTTQLEAVCDVDVPPRIWQAIVQGASGITGRLWDTGTVGLRVVTPTEIRSLNRDYRSTDEITDVLSFPARTDHHHGDIALCWEQTECQAMANSNNVETEALALVCHGMLHLAGYNHETADTDAEMNRLTRELCKSVGVEVHTFGH